VEVLVVKISRLPFKSPATKCHLGVGFMERHKVYYKKEGGGFPRTWAMISLMNLNLLVVRLSIKNVPTMH